MVRYPDTLVVTYQEDGAFTDGNYTAGSEMQKTIKGRKEANAKGSLIATEDGAQIAYDYVFFAEWQEFEVPFNSVANINDGEWVGKVKRHANSQTKSRLWLSRI